MITTKEEYKEFLQRVEEAVAWDVIEPEEYEDACEYVGINYTDYDDPDELFKDLKKALRGN